MASIVNNYTSKHITALMMALLMAFALFGCASNDAPLSASTQIGIGPDRFSSLAQGLVADMRRFFSAQTIYQSKNDCPVRIMLDSQKLNNESSERINFNLITDGFRAHLDNPEHEKSLSLTGRKIIFVDTSRNIVAGKISARKCSAPKLGADYLLAGRISSDDKISKQDVRQKQTLIAFWLLDLETSAKAWTSPPYIFKSYGQNDVIYQ